MKLTPDQEHERWVTVADAVYAACLAHFGQKHVEPGYKLREGEEWGVGCTIVGIDGRRYRVRVEAEER